MSTTARVARADAPCGHGGTPLPAELRIEQVSYTHPDARLLDEEVQAEYVVRYGTRDRTHMDPAEFEAPDGAFYVGYCDDRPVIMGGWRFRLDVSRLGSQRAVEVKRMYVAPTARRGGLARLMLAHLEATARTAGADVDHPRDRDRAARGDGALRVLRLPAGRPVRVLPRACRATAATAACSAPTRSRLRAVGLFGTSPDRGEMLALENRVARLEEQVARLSAALAARGRAGRRRPGSRCGPEPVSATVDDATPRPVPWPPRGTRSTRSRSCASRAGSA